MIKELDFSKETPEEMVDYLTMTNILCQVDEYGMDWEGVKRLFGEQAHDAARKLHEEEMKRSEGEL